MTHVKPQISKFKVEKSCQRLELCRSYMLAYNLYVLVLVATVLSTFRTDRPRFEFSPNSPWAVSPYKTLHTNEMQTSTNDLTRLANAE